MRVLTNQQYNDLVEMAMNDPSGPLCVLCRRRHRKVTDKGPNRPAWALDWAHWKWNPRDGSVYRCTDHEFISIDEDGLLVVDRYADDDLATYQFPTPDDCRVVAEAIATVRGGWDDTEPTDREAAP